VRLRGTRYPTLRRARATVAGATAQVGAEALRRLHAYEGARYRPMRLTVHGPRGPLLARAWIAPGATLQTWT
jgi:hypothetical protein